MGVKKSFFKDVAYSGVSKYSTMIIALIVTAVLSRILSPEDFGIVAIATVFITFFNLLSDFGFATAIVQFKDLTDSNVRSIFGWSFWLAVVLSFSFFFASPLIASFYEKPLLATICKILSLQIFFTTINVVPNALLLKSKKFNIIAVRTLTIHVFCGIISVVGAFNGLGVYSLLINPVAGNLITFVVNVSYLKIGITFLPDLSSLKKIFSFSIFQFLFNFINYIGNNLDKMIIGKIVSLAGLGYYEKAYRLGQMPAQTINGVISPVLHPYLSDYQNQPKKLLDVYDRMNRILLTISSSVAAFCLLCSRELVLLVFGPQWIESIEYFAIISVTIITNLASSPTGAILQSSNKTKLLFILGFINVVVAISGLCVGAFVFGSIRAICLMGIVSSIISFINTYIATYKFCFKKSPIPILRFFAVPLFYFIIVGLGGYYLTALYGWSGILGPLLLKTISWLIATIVFLQLFSPFKPSLYYKMLFSYIGKKMNRNSGGAF